MNLEHANEEFILERFTKSLALRIGGRFAHVAQSKEMNMSSSESTELLMLGSHGEIQVTMLREGALCDQNDFLFLVRLFDSVFPAFRIGSSNSEVREFESRFSFEIILPENAKVYFTCAFYGQFSTIERHHMQWFIMSEQYITTALLAIPSTSDTYLPVIDAPSLGHSYQLEWLSQSQDGRDCYRMAKEFPSVANIDIGSLLLGEITVSLVDLCLFLGGAPLTFALPQIIEGIGTDRYDPIVSIRSVAGDLKRM